MAILMARVSAVMLRSYGVGGWRGQYAGVRCSRGGVLTAVRVAMTHL